MYFSKSSKYCLICNKFCDREQIGDPDSSRDECSCHGNPSLILGPVSEEFGWDGSETLRHKLKYIFVLRKLLDYPGKRCARLLKQFREGAGNGENEEDSDPGKRGDEDGLFSVCSGCSPYLEEGHEVYHKICELEDRMHELKQKLKEMIVEGGKDANDKGRDSDKGRTIHAEVREYFVVSKKNAIQKVPFPDESIVKQEVLDNDGDFDDETVLENDWIQGSDCEMANSDNVDPLHSPSSPTGSVEDQDGSPAGSDDDDKDVRPTGSDDDQDVKPAIRKHNEKNRKKVHVGRSLRQTTKKRKFSDATSEAEDEPAACNRSEVGEDRSGSEFAQTENDSAEVNSDSDSGQPEPGDGKKHGFDQNKCNICNATYVTAHRLREHLDLHSKKSGVVKCKVCPFVCLTQRGLLIHNTKIHSENKRKSTPLPKKRKSSEDSYSCTYCEAKYKTAHRLKEHEDLHSRNDVLKCESCEYVCLQERGMKIHWTKTHKSVEVEDNESSEGEFSDNNEGDDDYEVELGTAEEESSDDGHKIIEPSGANSDNKGEYSCDICGTSFKTDRRLKFHTQLHENPEALRCEEAGCKFVGLSYLHMETHKGRVHPTEERLQKMKRRMGPFKCSRCPAIYQMLHRFKEHQYLHSRPSSISCGRCGWAFLNTEQRDRHMLIKHSEKTGTMKNIKKTSKRPKTLPRKTFRRNRVGPFICEHCGAIYKDRYRFKAHVKTYHKEKCLQCDKCQEYYENEEFLDDHRKSCKGPESDTGDEAEEGLPKKHRCKQCNEAFVRRKALWRHLREKHSESAQHECPHCPACFTTNTKLRFHISRAHPDKHNVCQVCGYKANCASHLTLHMQKHTKQKISMCEICSKSFASPSYLNAHKVKEHHKELGLEPIKCDRCDALLPTPAQLKYHITRVHDQKFKYVCQHCGKGFLFRSHLEKHATIHSTERNKICELCGAAYANPYVLTEHMKSHHPEAYAAAKGLDPESIKKSRRRGKNDDGPFTCKVCNAQFPMRWNLHDHLKTHSDIFEKFKCESCGKGYSSVGGLKRHEEAEHSNLTFCCNFCGKGFPCRDYLRLHRKKHCSVRKELELKGKIKSE